MLGLEIIAIACIGFFGFGVGMAVTEANVHPENLVNKAPYCESAEQQVNGTLYEVETCYETKQLPTKITKKSDPL